MTEAFTPGPWRVEEGTTLVWGACDPDDRSTYGMGYPITQVRVRLGAATEYMSEFREDEAEANARLIAAAPSLYRALKRIAEGDEPRTIGRNWRADGVPSKHDACTHGRFFYEDCGNCTSDFASSVLAASGIEAGTAETVEQGSVHEIPIGEAETPQ